MKDQNNKFLLSIKALSLASLIALLAGCEAEKIEDGEMPSVDVDAEGGELPSVTVNEGDLPDVDVDADAGKLPEYDIDSKLEVGTRQETITVPEVRWDEDEVGETEVRETETDVATSAQTPPSATQPPPHQQELFVEQQEMEMLTQQEQGTQAQNQSQQQPSESQTLGQNSQDQSQQLVDRLRNELDSDSPAMQDIANVQVEMQQDRLILQGQAQNEESKQDIVEAAENIADGREVVDNIQIGSGGTVGSTF